MSHNELPSDEDPEQQAWQPSEAELGADQWDLSGQGVGRNDDPDLVLRDGDDTATNEFGELVDESESDIDGTERDGHAAVTDRPDPIEEAARLLTSREAEIFGLDEAPDDVAAAEHHKAEMARNSQLMTVYELAGYLHASSRDPGADASEIDEAEIDSQTWETPTGQVSISQRSDASPEDEPARVRLPDLEGIETPAGTLDVHTQRLVPLADGGNQVEVNVQVSFDTTEGGSVFWKGLSMGFTRPEDGSPCPEGEEAILGGIDQDKLPPGVTMDQAVENVLLSHVLESTLEACSYASRKDEANTDDEDIDLEVEEYVEAAATAEAEAVTEADEQGGSELSVRGRALNDAGTSLYAAEKTGTTYSDSLAIGSAYVNLAEIAGREGRPELVAEYCQRLEAMEGVHADMLARAYSAGCAVGIEEMHEKLDTLLTGEMIERMSDGSDPNGVLGMSGLRQVIRDYETQGLSPEQLIESYAVNGGERFTLSRNHYAHMQETDPAAALALNMVIQDFARDGLNDYSPQFITAATPYTFDVCRDPVLRAQVIDQYMSAVDRLPVSSRTFYHLVQMGNRVLGDTELSDSGLAQQLNTMIEVQSQQLGMGEHYVHLESRKWNVEQIAHSEVLVEDLIRGINESTEKSIERSEPEIHEVLAQDHGELLKAGAVAYATQGKFVQSRELIAELGAEWQAGAYEACLRSAKKPSDVRQLKPIADPRVSAFDPDVAMIFEASEARVNGDVRAMETQVEKLAGFIAQAEEDQGDSPLPDATRCWVQAVDLLNTMRGLQPGSELRAARVFVRGMVQSPKYGSNLDMLPHSFGSLMDSDSPRDHEVVYEAIRDAGGSPAKKAELFTQLALRLTKK